MKKHQRGQAIVEFALVASIFVFMMFLIIMVGMAIFVGDSITNVAKTGSRYAIVRGAGCQIGVTGCPLGPKTISEKCPLPGGSSQSAIVNYLCGQLVPAISPHVTITVTWPENSNTKGHPVRVVMVYPYRLLFLPTVINLSGTSQMLVAR